MPTAPAEQPSHDAQRRGFAEPLGKRDTNLQDILQAALDIDLAFDIGSTQPGDVAGQEIAHQPRRAQGDRDLWFRGEFEDFPIPKNHAQG